MKIARVLCHPHIPVGDRAPTLWLPEEAIFKAMTFVGGVSVRGGARDDMGKGYKVRLLLRKIPLSGEITSEGNPLIG